MIAVPKYDVHFGHKLLFVIRSILIVLINASLQTKIYVFRLFSYRKLNKKQLFLKARI